MSLFTASLDGDVKLDSSARSAMREGGSKNRVLLLAQSGRIGRDLLAVEAQIQSECGLDPTIRELAILSVLRRSRSEVTARSTIAEQHGVTEEMLAAILAEDWTDPVFSSAQKAAFQFALQYDAGHSINSAVIESVETEFDEQTILELALVCSHFGAMARFAVGLQLDHLGTE